MSCWCTLNSLVTDVKGYSPYFGRHKEHFKGLKVPFGCAVLYYPSKGATDNRSKADPRLKLGIFMGYRQAPGGKIKDYLVADLGQFVGKNLEMTASHTTHYFRPHVTRTIKWSKYGIYFPLKMHTTE